MINGINGNDSNEKLLNTRLGGQNEVNSVVTNPIGNNNPYSKENKLNFIDESAISMKAYSMYQRECDVTNFKNIMNNIDESDANIMVQDLFDKGVIDPFSVEDFDKIAKDLSTNEEFLNDIEFNML